jgi:uncharacterized protein
VIQLKATDRRNEIIKILEASDQAVNATQLAEQFSVSRQIIVGDIALIRAKGIEVIATPRGYLSGKALKGEDKSFTAKVACLHSEAEVETELTIVVDNGGEVVDVQVEHPLYGTITGELHIGSRHDVADFMKKVAAKEVTMLSSLTGGVHIHTIACKDEAALVRIKHELKQAGILFEG